MAESEVPSLGMPKEQTSLCAAGARAQIEDVTLRPHCVPPQGLHCQAAKLYGVLLNDLRWYLKFPFEMEFSICSKGFAPTSFATNKMDEYLARVRTKMQEVEGLVPPIPEHIVKKFGLALKEKKKLQEEEEEKKKLHFQEEEQEAKAVHAEAPSCCWLMSCAAVVSIMAGLLIHVAGLTPTARNLLDGVLAATASGLAAQGVPPWEVVGMVLAFVGQVYVGYCCCRNARKFHQPRGYRALRMASRDQPPEPQIPLMPQPQWNG